MHFSIDFTQNAIFRFLSLFQFVIFLIPMNDFCAPFLVPQSKTTISPLLEHSPVAFYDLLYSHYYILFPYLLIPIFKPTYIIVLLLFRTTLHIKSYVDLYPYPTTPFSISRPFLFPQHQLKHRYIAVYIRDLCPFSFKNLGMGYL